MRAALRILLVGVGTVGESIARLAAAHPWCETMVLADYDAARAEALQASLGDAERFPVEHIDARDRAAVAALARRHRSDLVMNAVDPQFVMPLFEGALEAGTHYMDMANSLSVPHPTEPYSRPGVKLGDEQFARHDEWERSGRLALLGMGMDPGLTDVFARYAQDHLFDEVHEVHVRDGGDLAITGYAFAPVFSIWTTIEECLNPPVVWDAEQGGWITTEPFSAPEDFPFPEGIGPMECVNVEHEEVLLVPRSMPDVRRVTFKYALGADFIDKLKTIRDLGMDRTDKVSVKGVEVAPARRAGRHHPRPHHPWRPDGRPGHGRDLGHRPQGRPAARGVPLPALRRAGGLGAVRRAGGGMADRLQPGGGHGAAGHRCVVRSRASSDPRHLTPTHIWPSLTVTASTGGCTRWSLEPTSPPDHARSWTDER